MSRCGMQSMAVGWISYIGRDSSRETSGLGHLLG